MEITGNTRRRYEIYAALFPMCRETSEFLDVADSSILSLITGGSFNFLLLPLTFFKILVTAYCSTDEERNRIRVTILLSIIYERFNRSDL
jgi:hypothetical protein